MPGNTKKRSGLTATLLGLWLVCAGIGALWSAGISLPRQISSELPKFALTSSDHVTALAVGGSFACAIANGSLQCWGENKCGELGNGTKMPSPHPVKVVGLPPGDIQHMSAGQGHLCVVIADVPYCWGYNNVGEVGDGTVVSRELPTRVAGTFTHLSHLAAGRYHNCAVSDEGVQCWGHNQSYQLGRKTSERAVLKPVPLALPGTPTQLALGQEHSCALIAGAVWCWGQNKDGQLGLGVKSPSIAEPTLVPGLTGVKAITAQYGHTCALLDNSTVKCWGLNAQGELGAPTAGGGDLSPVTTTPIPGQVTAISGGSYFTLAIASGKLFAWGANESGQLGDGTKVSRRTPTPVVGLDGEVLSADGGVLHSCALTASSEVRCWGDYAHVIKNPLPTKIGPWEK